MVPAAAMLRSRAWPAGVSILHAKDPQAACCLLRAGAPQIPAFLQPPLVLCCSVTVLGTQSFGSLLLLALTRLSLASFGSNPREGRELTSGVSASGWTEGDLGGRGLPPHLAWRKSSLALKVRGTRVCAWVW